MTRKQYNKKMRQFAANINEYAEKNGLKKSRQIYRFPIPKFGTIVEYGKYKGQKLTSYKMCWDVIYDTIKDNEQLSKGL